MANDLTESAFDLKLSRHLRTLLKMKLTLYLFEERKANFFTKSKLNVYKKIALNTHSRLRSERHEKEK